MPSGVKFWDFLFKIESQKCCVCHAAAAAAEGSSERSDGLLLADEQRSEHHSHRTNNRVFFTSTRRFAAAAAAEVTRPQHSCTLSPSLSLWVSVTLCFCPPPPFTAYLYFECGQKSVSCVVCQKSILKFKKKEKKNQSIIQ